LSAQPANYPKKKKKEEKKKEENMTWLSELVLTKF